MQRLSLLLRLLSGAVMLISAVLLCYGFFKWSWMKGGGSTLTPYQIWIGKDKYDQDFTFNMAAYDRPRYRSHGSVGGFDDVRGVDRLLVFIPGAALVLGQVAVLTCVRRLAVNRPALLIAVTALAITFALTLFPFVWQSLSTSNWQNYYEKQQPPELAHAWVRGRTELYDSWEFVLCAGVGLLGALLAVGLEVNPRRAPAPLPDISGGRVEPS